MFTHLNLTNFKIWRSTSTPEQPRLDLAPITLLLGTNSSGKSSLIQSLLLIRQTVTSGDDSLDLNLGDPDDGDTLTLGGFTDVHRQGAEREPMVIEFGWRQAQPQVNGLFNAQYTRAPGGQAELKRLTLQIDADKGFVATRQGKGAYKLNVHGLRIALRARNEYKPLRSFRIPDSALESLGSKRSIGFALSAVAMSLSNELALICYLGPVRAKPQRSYSWNGKLPPTLGDDGAHAAQALIASWRAGELARKRQEPEPPQYALFAQAGAWLRKLGLAGGLDVTALGSGRYELRVRSLLDLSSTSNLRDVGAGVTQVLPVITLVLSAPPGSVVILEEPESHLHPAAQTELAELLIAARQRGVQVIVESHSEHMLLRLQRRVAESVVHESEVTAYFCSRSGEAPKIERLRLNEMGEIENWPDNFFGDEMTELSARTLAGLKKRGISVQIPGRTPNE